MSAYLNLNKYLRHFKITIRFADLLIPYLNTDLLVRYDYDCVTKSSLFCTADFGFARFLEEGNMAVTLCGSPMYMVIKCYYYDQACTVHDVQKNSRLF